MLEGKVREMVVGEVTDIHTQEVNDEVDLVNLRLARQEWLVEKQFTKDAAGGPHVHP